MYITLLGKFSISSYINFLSANITPSILKREKEEGDLYVMINFVEKRVRDFITITFDETNWAS